MKKSRKIILIVMISALVLGIAAIGAAWGLGYLHFGPADVVEEEIIVEEVVDITNLAAVERYYVASETASITFTASVSKSVESLELYAGEEVVGTLCDDGLLGDENAGDGVYTCVLETVVYEVGVVHYSARVGIDTSLDCDIYYFAKPTEEDVAVTEAVIAELDTIEDGYVDDKGYVEISDRALVLEEVAIYAQELLEEGTILLYEENDDNVLLKFSTGLTVVCQPSVEAVSSTGDVVYMEALSLQPNEEDYEPNTQEWIEGVEAEIIDTLGTVESCSVDEGDNLDNEGVTLEAIQSLTENQVVIWQGHGAYSESLHACLATGEVFDWEQWVSDSEYQLDCVNDSIVCGEDEVVMITSTYIDKYCESLENSVFYLGTCYSGTDDVLAQAFLNKGATAVVGNTEEIFTIYNITVMAHVMKNLAQINPFTDDYYTLAESLELAQESIGSTDMEWYLSSYPDEEEEKTAASVVIFGGTEAEEFQFTIIPPEAVIPEDAFEYNEHSYYIYPDAATTIEEAENYFYEIGGYLATAEDDEEIAALYGYIVEQGYENYTVTDGIFSVGADSENRIFVCEWDSIVIEVIDPVWITELEILNREAYGGGSSYEKTCIFYLDGSLEDTWGGGYTKAFGNVGIDGSVYSHGLEVYLDRTSGVATKIAWASIDYNLEGIYTTLTGGIGVIASDQVNNIENTIYFYDGENQLASYKITEDNYDKDIEVDVTGVETLTIYITDNVEKFDDTSYALYDMLLQ